MKKIILKIIINIVLAAIVYFFSNILFYMLICNEFTPSNEKFRSLDFNYKNLIIDKDNKSDRIDKKNIRYVLSDIINELYYDENLGIIEIACLNEEGVLSRGARDMVTFFLQEDSSLFSYCESIMLDAKYFPVALFDEEKKEVEFEDSWFKERTYGGNRQHEGTDIMAINNKRGYYPVVSMSDGIVKNIGWLKLGGYRIGIISNNNVYFYYAHLHAYAQDYKVGDEVKAGELLGFMGDTGYSEIEGTTGNFDVHLHLGIYVYNNDEEISINPYYFLKYLEKYKIYYKNCK